MCLFGLCVNMSECMWACGCRCTCVTVPLLCLFFPVTVVAVAVALVPERQRPLCYNLLHLFCCCCRSSFIFISVQFICIPKCLYPLPFAIKEENVRLLSHKGEVSEHSYFILTTCVNGWTRIDRGIGQWILAEGAFQKTANILFFCKM